MTDVEDFKGLLDLRAMKWLDPATRGFTSDDFIGIPLSDAIALVTGLGITSFITDEKSHLVLSYDGNVDVRAERERMILGRAHNVLKHLTKMRHNLPSSYVVSSKMWHEMSSEDKRKVERLIKPEGFTNPNYKDWFKEIGVPTSQYFDMGLNSWRALREDEAVVFKILNLPVHNLNEYTEFLDDGA